MADDLIARLWETVHSRSHGGGNSEDPLLEEAAAVIAAQAAVIEAASVSGPHYHSREDYFAALEAAQDALASAPSVSLDAVKAEAWAEGYVWATDRWLGGGFNPDDAPNPYRSGVTR